jgi:hypothetical protein
MRVCGGLEVELEVNWGRRSQGSNATKMSVDNLVATSLLCNKTTINHPWLRKYSHTSTKELINAGERILTLRVNAEPLLRLRIVLGENSVALLKIFY